MEIYICTENKGGGGFTDAEVQSLAGDKEVDRRELWRMNELGNDEPRKGSLDQESDDR